VRRIFEYFEFETEIEKMREANILNLVVSKFADVDLHPDRLPNEEIGLIFENVPLKEDIDAYFEREMRPHVPDAWMDRSKDKVGY
jgi:hypothetical protein